jgi:FtsH-binding integral membrane protein
MPSIFFSLTISAILSSIFALFTMYGISSIIKEVFPDLSSSIEVLART